MEAGVTDISMNEQVREYLTELCNLAFLEVRLGRLGRGITGCSAGRSN